MKPVLVIALLAAAIGSGHLWVIALYYGLPTLISVVGAAGTIAFGVLAGLVADRDESEA